ncbi:restriction endonuclease subunit S [Polyangium sp. y55x31]|uniref:restriction endonuclease subunit S n=1 Tax=Polyangium sp. y55x31 TaxID=3042688 RepID=UPI002482BB34|nr:restriction endonuclease subunit S [Polyangium sp. y55x31]MDI1475689.1 restriction endonuclease subunit S [Polyangium sp. y55x31]
MPKISGASLRQMMIPLPPPTERGAIAEALGDVDALISGLDRLIAKKRDLKQAAMQQLLTGKQRLPGFHGEWEMKTLGSLGAWLSGGTPSMSIDKYWSGDIPWVSPKDMKVALLHDTIDHVSNSALGNGTRLLPEGAILLVVRGMILAHSLPVARAMRPVAFNQDMKGLVVAADVDSNFVLWWLTANESLLLSKTTESTHGTKRMPTEALFEVKIALPELPEQTAIAAVLSDMDAEISALEQRRDKVSALKQGMMQELLTGRTRLV